MVKRILVLCNLAFLLALPAPAHAAGVCSIVRQTSGKVYAKLVSDPGGDGALYVYVDGVQTTWFSTKKKWFYVTSQKNAVVRGYDSELELECSG